jgi:hypothetical protein
MVFHSLISVAGLVVAVYATIIFLILAFRASLLWGLACFLPVFPLVFLMQHWDEAWRPFFAAFFGWIVFFTLR